MKNNMNSINSYIKDGTWLEARKPTLLILKDPVWYFVSDYVSTPVFDFINFNTNIQEFFDYEN